MVNTIYNRLTVFIVFLIKIYPYELNSNLDLIMWKMMIYSYEILPFLMLDGLPAIEQNDSSIKKNKKKKR